MMILFERCQCLLRASQCMFSRQVLAVHSSTQFTLSVHSAQLPVNSFASAQLAFIFLPAFGGSRHVLTIMMRMMITMTLTYEYDVMMIEN